MKPFMQFDLLNTLTDALGSREGVTDDIEIRPSVEAGLSGAGFDGVAPSMPRSVRVLLAEDNVINQKLALTVLQKRGYDVALAGNGREAVDAHAEALTSDRPFDVILMDVQMPAMNGYEATGHIRETEQPLGRHTPIIAVTAHARREDEERCLAAGMDSFISKPIKIKDVGDQIEKLVPSHTEKGPDGDAAAGSSNSIQSSASVFDRNVLLNLVGGIDSYVDELVTMFLESEQEYVDAIRAAVADGDSVATRAAVHALQGVLASIVATAARSTACRLEELAVTGDVSGAAPLLAELDVEMERLRTALAAEA